MPCLVHQERDVLHVVVLVAGDDVERHTAELLLDVIHRQPEAPNHQDRLLVGVSCRVVEVEVRDGPK